jgi:DNA sulfur modification protein DndD
MKLEFVRLINFRQYFGEQTADFSTFGDLNVSVFHGSNGAGKTSLFCAINWCLYDAGIGGIGQLLSKEAFARAKEGELIPCVVSVGFIHNGHKYIAERVTNYVKIGREAKLEKSEFYLTQTKKSGDSESIPNPIGVMNSILPSNIRPYFFFDGEKMDELTKAGSNEIEEAVRNIMRLPTIERAQVHLQEIADEFRREIKKKGSHLLEELITKEENIRLRKEQSIKRKEEVREAIRLGRHQIEDIDNQLRGSEAAKEIQNHRDSIQKMLVDLEGREEAILKTIQKLVNRNYLVMLSEVSEKALLIVNQKREKGEIPSGIREQFIKDLLESGICVCGRKFSSEDEAHQHLTSLLKHTASGKLENEVGKLGGNIQSMSVSAASSSEALNDRCKEMAKIKENITRLYAELDDVKRQLIGTSIDEIVALERRRSISQRQLETSLAEYGRIDSDLNSIENQLDEIKKQREAAETKEKEIDLLVRKERLSQRAADAVAKIKDEFFEKTRQEIEAATKEVFSKLAWKQDHFQDVCLDQDFKLEVIDRWGTPTRKELSAGERQILSLSFITAMSRLSGEEAPLVMDTPFGRLSGNHLTAVAENLPNLTPQLILFVTDREWDEASKTKLEPRTGAQYDLCFNEKTGCTEIAETCYE